MPRLLALTLLLAASMATLPSSAAGNPPPLKESSPKVESALNDVIRRQIAAFSAGDFAKAYTLASAAFRGKVTQTAFEQMVKQGYPTLLRSTKIEFGPALDDGETGVVYVRVTDAQGVQLYLYSLRREEGEWRVMGVSQKEEEPAAPPSAPSTPPPASSLPTLSA